MDVMAWATVGLIIYAVLITVVYVLSEVVERKRKSHLKWEVEQGSGDRWRWQLYDARDNEYLGGAGAFGYETKQQACEGLNLVTGLEVKA